MSKGFTFHLWETVIAQSSV